MKSVCLELLICVTIFCKVHTIKICLYYVIVISILEENWQIAALCFFCHNAFSAVKVWRF